MKISTCTNKHFLRKIEVFIRFDSFLMYIDIHTKSHNFLKISMFSNKIFTLTSRAQLFEKVKISHKISIFVPKKLTVLHKNWCWEKHSLLYPKVLHDLILSLYLKIHSFGQKLTLFALNDIFLPKRNNAIKIWHFSKTENTSLRKLNISTRNEHFWKEWPFARKMKKSFNIGVFARFPLIPLKHI